MQEIPPILKGHIKQRYADERRAIVSEQRDLWQHFGVQHRMRHHPVKASPGEVLVISEICVQMKETANLLVLRTEPFAASVWLHRNHGFISFAFLDIKK